MKMTSPSLPAVQSWLGQELETRGIDAVIYTRYILSILQQDGYEPDVDGLDSEPFRFRKQKQTGRVNGKGKKRKGLLKVSAEDRKKIAVLECLQSVTEEVRIYIPPFVYMKKTCFFWGGGKLLHPIPCRTKHLLSWPNDG